MAYEWYKIAGFSGGWHSGEIGINVVSQDVAGNYSVVDIAFRVRKDVTSSSYNLGGANMFIALDGVTKLSSNSIDFRSYVIGNWYYQLQALNQTVYHNPDGTRNISVRGYCATGVGAGTYDQTQALALPTIPRKSSISSLTPTVDVNGTNAVTVAISRASASFTHTVTFYFGAYSQAYTGVATSKSFAIPTSWLNAIPNSISGVALCRVETFSGATSLGYVDGAFTMAAPATIIPTVTDIAFARDTTGTDPFTTYVKGISKVNVSGVSVTNQYSATTALLKTYLHLASASYTTGILNSGASFITGVMPSAGTMRLTTVVTDSRGRESASYYEDFTVYDYFTPTLTVAAFRCNATGVADPAGGYLSTTMTVTVAPVNNNNTKTYVLEYKKTTDSTWTSISTAALSGYAGTLNAIRSASPLYTWEVRATVIDKVNTVTKSISVTSKRVGINIGSSGTAVAIGKVAETADLFEVDLATKFNKGISIGTLTLDNYLLNRFYPVGTIYMAITNTNPGTLMGGTWVSWGTGRVPVGVDVAQTEFNTIEKTGGHKNLQAHVHSINPPSTQSGGRSAAHTHSVPSRYSWAGSNTPINWTTSGARAAENPTQYGSSRTFETGTESADHSHAVNIAAFDSASTGGGNAENLQPYITCYMWKRTA
jgi:hypothetical protein